MKPEGDAYINIEKFLYPLSFLCTLPFIYDIGKSDNKFLTIIKTLSVIIIIYIGFVKINKAGKVYSNRITYLNQMIDKSKNINSDKVILDKKNIDIKKIGPPWAVGVESILLSSLSDKTISIYISNDIRQEIIKPSDSDIYFCVPFNKRVNVNSLNNNYFKLSSSKPQKIEDSF